MDAFFSPKKKRWMLFFVLITTLTTPRNLETGAEKKEKRNGWEQRHLTDRSTDEWPSFMRTDVADKMSGTSIFNSHQSPSLMSEWSGSSFCDDTSPVGIFFLRPKHMPT
jgi:hypothetical protein